MTEPVHLTHWVNPKHVKYVASCKSRLGFSSGNIDITQYFNPVLNADAFPRDIDKQKFANVAMAEFDSRDNTISLYETVVAHPFFTMHGVGHSVAGFYVNQDGAVVDVSTLSQG